MAKRHLLLFLALVMLSFNAFSQTQPQGDGRENNPYLISTKAQFEAIAQQQNGASGKYFKQTADIDLGSIGDTSDAIIGTEFKGTYDGGGFTITYSASFLGTTYTGDYGLFSTVSGTIKNLNVNADITLGGSATAMNVALLCGYLKEDGNIMFCNVSGNVNSSANAGTGGGSDAGLIVGESKGNIAYCTGIGNVVGVGYAGGLVGQLSSPAVVRGCAFTGSVTALACGWEDYSSWGSFAGGICGFANSGTTIDLCYANAEVVAVKQTHAAVSTNTLVWLWFNLGGTPTVTNNYVAGTINGEDLDSSDDITNSAGYTTGNYFRGQMSAQDIADSLNNAAAGDTNIHFSVVNGEVVFGRVEMICETPINLVVEKNYGDEFTITWETGTDATINETTWHWTLTGGNPSYRNAEGQRAGTTTTPSMVFDNVYSSGEPYIFTVYTDCSTVQNGLLSNSASARFYMFGLQASYCYSVENLSYSNVGVTNATISWEKNANSTSTQYQIKVNDEEPIVQSDTTITFENLQPGTTYNVEVREQCSQNGEDVWGNPETITFTTLSYYETAKSGVFNESSTWVGGRAPIGNAGEIKIQQGHEVTLSHTLVLRNNCQIINEGVLIIKQQGELINTTINNVNGIVEIETPQKLQNNWTFIGAPFAGYKLECIKPAPSADISISKYDYTQGDWSNEWATVSTEMEAAEGYFAWPFYSGAVTYTTYGDVCVKNEETKIWEEKPYDFDKEPATELNNADIINVNKTLKEEQTHGGYWMALSNPYPFKLKVATFLADNSLSESNPNPDPNSDNVIQGEVIYKFNGTSWTTHNDGDINMTEGFFVNFTNGGAKTATFKKTQRLENQAKSSRTPREFVKFALVDGKKEIDLLFAHNEKSENSYDIYDANKMFSPIEIAEPYFVTNGLALVKEEVKELPYYATMNVRSYKDTVMSFVMKEIPTGLKVFIIDGKEMIEMFEGSVYTTEFLKGENIDRFKLFVRKADALDLNAQSGVSITNCNRLVNVQTKEDNLYVEVYNALGQKVYSTREYNFNLNELPAGSYVVKAYNKRVNESVKIVIN